MRPINHASFNERRQDSEIKKVLEGHARASLQELYSTHSYKEACLNGREFLTKTLHGRVKQVGITVYDMSIMRVEP